MTAARHALRHVYYQHGLFSFLLFFAPLVPGIVESHTKLYLKLAHSLTGDVNNAKEAIKQMFGARGLKAYDTFIENHPALIRPSVIMRTIYEDESLENGLFLIEQLFTNPHQRNYTHADVFRTTIISEYHRFFHAFKSAKYQGFRSQLIQLLLQNSRAEKAIEPKIATAETCWQLLQTTHSIENARRLNRENVKYDHIEASIKAKLAGHATALDPTFTKLYDVTRFHKHLLTQTDVDTLKHIVNSLQQDQSPDVKETAFVHARNLHGLTLALT